MVRLKPLLGASALIVQALAAPSDPATPVLPLNGSNSVLPSYNSTPALPANVSIAASPVSAVNPSATTGTTKTFQWPALHDPVPSFTIEDWGMNATASYNTIEWYLNGGYANNESAPDFSKPYPPTPPQLEALITPAEQAIAVLIISQAPGNLQHVLPAITSALAAGIVGVGLAEVAVLNTLTNFLNKMKLPITIGVFIAQTIALNVDWAPYRHGFCLPEKQSCMVYSKHHHKYHDYNCHKNHPCKNLGDVCGRRLVEPHKSVCNWEARAVWQAFTGKTDWSEMIGEVHGHSMAITDHPWHRGIMRKFAIWTRDQSNKHVGNMANTAKRYRREMTEAIADKARYDPLKPSEQWLHKKTVQKIERLERKIKALVKKARMKRDKTHKKLQKMAIKTQKKRNQMNAKHNMMRQLALEYVAGNHVANVPQPG
ncbi:hypothetical protein ANO11243_087620 [Dothideomycetidae sp. 11243]|nr:hypothetical protein ANO11243_087620 [fungal sp. No.11243]